MRAIAAHVAALKSRLTLSKQNNASLDNLLWAERGEERTWGRVSRRGRMGWD